MKSFMGGTYLENVRKTFLPEFLSMNFVMAGMAPIMVFLMMGRDMRAMQPEELLFWGVMSLAVIVGFAVAYPVNTWLVAKSETWPDDSTQGVRCISMAARFRSWHGMERASPNPQGLRPIRSMSGRVNATT